MEYTVKALAELAGVTARTLRWYHKLGLLKPGRTTPAGYRLYGPAEVDRLQQILFYRELGLPLGEIGAVLDDPAFDRQEALQSHLRELKQRRSRLDDLIGTVERTLLAEKGECAMTDKEKFEGFKKALVEKNEACYGKEAREAYGDGAVEGASGRLMGLSQEEYDRWQSLDRTLREGLQAAVRIGEEPAGPEGRRLAALHLEWLRVLMPQCTLEQQRGIAVLYVSDERFTAYYDREVKGCARFLYYAVCGGGLSLPDFLQG